MNQLKSIARRVMTERGEYVLDLPGQEPDGHFGLAVSDYTHSTAPNRRFPDLVTPRLIKAAIAGEPVPYNNSELGALARHPYPVLVLLDAERHP